MRYSDFCELFVPKSQKVLAELTAKVPKNVTGDLSYDKCFDQNTKEIYRHAWEFIFDAQTQENLCKLELMRDKNFEIGANFQAISSNGETISREDLIAVLPSLD